jgi:hypothetical protein
MFAMFPGFEERVITVATPAEVARRAATILVDMPPVPRREPALETGTMLTVNSFPMRRVRHHLLVTQQCLQQLQ